MEENCSTLDRQIGSHSSDQSPRKEAQKESGGGPKQEKKGNSQDILQMEQASTFAIDRREQAEEAVQIEFLTFAMAHGRISQAGALGSALCVTASPSRH